MSVLTKDRRYTEISAMFSKETEEVNMCEVLDKVETRGKEIGEKIGRKYGMETINKLYSLLLSKGMNDDVTRAITDKKYCEYILQKYASALA